MTKEKETEITDDEYLLLRRFRRLKRNHFGSIVVELISGGTEMIIRGAGDDVKMSVISREEKE